MPPITAETALLDWLGARGIAYTRYEHLPVFTCDEAARLRVELPGLETKNLFLCDDRGQRYLVVTACEKRLDLKSLARVLGASKLRFGSEALLLETLGLTPGAVTILALVNDPARQVRLVVDAQYWPAPTYLCHPLVNTATLVIEHDGLMRFLAITGHAPAVVEIDAR